jgi:hypothetical protein
MNELAWGITRKQWPLPQDTQPLGTMPKELGGEPKAIDIDKSDTGSSLKNSNQFPETPRRNTFKGRGSNKPKQTTERKK